MERAVRSGKSTGVMEKAYIYQGPEHYYEKEYWGSRMTYLPYSNQDDLKRGKNEGMIKATQHSDDQSMTGDGGLTGRQSFYYWREMGNALL